MKSMSDLLLNVAATMSRSRANGPGARAVIWVQGCTIGCPGCYSAPTHPHSANSLIEPTAIVEWILSIPDIEGITFSGGEPFEQAAALFETVKLLQKQRPTMTVFAFSGYTYEELLTSTELTVSELLHHCDMVSTGSYVAKLENQSLLWRGSSNQELHYLTEVYNSSMEEKWVLESPTEEYSVHSEGIQFTGFGGKTSKVLRMATELIG
jgi:anaerobic ribonucleoside-triphosphate reductase activating protein